MPLVGQVQTRGWDVRTCVLQKHLNRNCKYEKYFNCCVHTRVHKNADGLTVDYNKLNSNWVNREKDIKKAPQMKYRKEERW